MATGHLNPGYDTIVSRMKSALVNPSGARRAVSINRAELNAIKTRAKSAWAHKDTSLTTYNHFFRDPEIKDPIGLRPTSPTRRNNPHPDITFQSAHLKKSQVPGYFDADAALADDKSYCVENTAPVVDISSRPKTASSQYSTQRPVSRTVAVYPSASHYLQDLPHDEASQEETRLRNCGVDTTLKRPLTAAAALSSTKKHIYFRPDSSSLKRAYQTTDSRPSSGVNTTPTQQQHIASNSFSKTHLQSNLLNPFLYDDYRMYREKYASGDHGMPNPFGKKPFRGDFMMHPDWHPYLYHHRLPYYY